MYILYYKDLSPRMVYNTHKGRVAVGYEALELGYHEDINNCFSGFLDTVASRTHILNGTTY